MKLTDGRELLARVRYFKGVKDCTWKFIGANGRQPIVHGG
jgi:hypothetical protein